MSKLTKHFLTDFDSDFTFSFKVPSDPTGMLVFLEITETFDADNMSRISVTVPVQPVTALSVDVGFDIMRTFADHATYKLVYETAAQANREVIMTGEIACR